MQEEIREGIRYFVQGDCAYFGKKECPFENNLACQECDERIHELLSYLDSQGVVLKVENWLPTRSGMTCTIEPLVGEPLKRDMENILDPVCE